MNEEYNQAFASATKSQEDVAQLMAKLIGMAQPSTVYSAPLQVEQRTIVTACEVSMGIGFGMGSGGGMAPPPDGGEQPSGGANAGGMGGGGGGGGGGMARPVAVISIGPDGVHVEPIVDATKIALALFTTIGSMFFMLGRMRRGHH